MAASMAVVPEYCFLAVQSWCMPRSDWAAWVQACGALLALLLALGIQWWQGFSQERTAIRAAQSYQAAAIAAIRQLEDVCEKQEAPRYLPALKVLREIALAGRGVPFPALSHENGGKYWTFHAAVVEALEQATDKVPTNWRHHQKMFEGTRESLMAELIF